MERDVSVFEVGGPTVDQLGAVIEAPYESVAALAFAPSLSFFIECGHAPGLEHEHEAPFVVDASVKDLLAGE